MEEYRALIMRDETGFAKIIGDIAAGRVFDLEGDSYKRNRYTGRYPEIAGWFNRKNTYLAANRTDVSETFDFNLLVGRLEKGFTSLADIYHFWRRASSV
jgi:hypothetical protein